jgi:sodium--glutamate symport carrier gltS
MIGPARLPMLAMQSLPRSFGSSLKIIIIIEISGAFFIDILLLHPFHISEPICEL